MKAADLSGPPLRLLADTFLHPSRVRRRAADPNLRNRIMWLAFGWLFAVPGSVFLALYALERLAGLPFATTSALDWGRLGLAVGYLLVYVGSVPEGTTLGIVGGVAGVLAGGLLDGLGPASQFAVTFGLSLGATYNVRRGRGWRFRQGLREAALGGLVFLAAGSVLEGGPILLPLAQRGDVAFGLNAAAGPALRGGLPAGALFAGSFLTGYLGLLFYPIEVGLFAIQCRRARREPERALYHLWRSPLTHEGRRLPLRRARW